MTYSYCYKNCPLVILLEPLPQWFSTGGDLPSAKEHLTVSGDGFVVTAWEWGNANCVQCERPGVLLNSHPTEHRKLPPSRIASKYQQYRAEKPCSRAKLLTELWETKHHIK